MDSLHEPSLGCPDNKLPLVDKLKKRTHTAYGTYRQYSLIHSIPRVQVRQQVTHENAECAPVALPIALTTKARLRCPAAQGVLGHSSARSTSCSRPVSVWTSTRVTSSTAKCPDQRDRRQLLMRHRAVRDLSDAKPQAFSSYAEPSFRAKLPTGWFRSALVGVINYGTEPLSL